MILLPLILPIAIGHPVQPAAMMQIGPDPSPRAPSDLPIPRRRRAESSSPEQAAAQPGEDRLATCLSKAADDAAQGLAEAHAWLAETKLPAQQVRANQCLGLVLVQEGAFAQAGEAFAAAIAGIPSGQMLSAVPLMAMAGNAALADGKAAAALAWFDRALAVPVLPQDAAAGALHADRSRALVSLGRDADATRALEQAVRLAPDDPEAWLLSATLARRGGDLAKAQQHIETAARLGTRDPGVGLEAGIIAVLDRRDEAARKTWQSVIDMAPSSDEARAARSYLAQLGPAPTSPAPPSVPEKNIP